MALDGAAAVTPDVFSQPLITEKKAAATQKFDDYLRICSLNA